MGERDGYGFDLLAFGPHPDDVELGMGGTIALHAARGHRVAICDLTAGEFGTGGDPRTRAREAEEAARILGVGLRMNLGLPDRGLVYGAGGRGAGGEQVRRVVEVIRRLRPRVVALPWGDDRHPDHVAAHHLLREALFTAALAKYETAEPPHRPQQMVFYFLNDAPEPSFLVDISVFRQKKSESLFAYRSQFEKAAGSPETPLNAPHGLLYRIESRDRYYGSLIGVEYAEGFRLRQPPVLEGLPGLHGPSGPG